MLATSWTEIRYHYVAFRTAVYRLDNVYIYLSIRSNYMLFLYHQTRVILILNQPKRLEKKYTSIYNGQFRLNVFVSYHIFINPLSEVRQGIA